MPVRPILAIVFVATLLGGCAARRAEMSWVERWGEPVPPSATTRTIVIAPDTKYVNVTGGEVIRFVEGEKSFGWSFDGQLGYAFELNRVAPPGILDHHVMAYVDPDPYYSGR
ncbi:MAG TPA: CzcE family metal-binding protein [Burkholderiaceae bacterium]